MGKSPIEHQAEKIFKHARAGSHATRAKYKDICLNATRWINSEFKMKNLRNLQDKHLVAYAKHLQDQELSPKTVKDRLGAIRYMHDQISNAKHEISDNKTLQKEFNFKLTKIQVVKGNRAWTAQEYEKMMQIAKQVEMSKADTMEARSARDYQDIATISRTMGLRVAEATLASRSQAERSLRTGVYHVGKEAKNGKERDVKLSPEVRKMFERRLKNVERGQKLFVQIGEKSHHAIDRIEQFNKNHRHKAETEEGKQLRKWTDRHQKKTFENKLTMHGMRYNYIQDRVQQEVDKGFSVEQAASIVTKEVGHERHDVIYIYLGGK